MSNWTQKNWIAWNQLTPEQRDYDRLFSKTYIPPETRPMETEGGRKAAVQSVEKNGCYCHVNPPCDFCTGMTEEEADIAWAKGSAEVVKLRQIGTNNE